MSAALLKEHTTNNGQEGQKAMANLNAELTDLKTKVLIFLLCLPFIISVVCICRFN
jgi:hypothetical protein